MSDVAASAGLRASAKGLQRQAYELQRAADQADYEAALNAAVTVALDAVTAERANTARLTASVEGKVTAERAADDELRAAAEFVAGCAEAEKLSQAAGAPLAEQTEASLKLHYAVEGLGRKRRALETARQERQAAEQALAAHRQRAAGLEAEHARAAQRAANPGQAPRTSALPMGVGTVADMTAEERQLIAVAVLALAKSRPEPPGAPEEDPSAFRFRRLGHPGGNPGGIVAIPPGIPGR